MQSRSRLARMLAAGRRKHRLTQPELASRIGVSPRSIETWETGEHVPQMRKLRLVAAELGLDVRELHAARWDESERRRRAREKARKEAAA